MKAALRFLSCLALCYGTTVVFAQAPVDLNIGPAGQFCGLQTATEVKCTMNAYFEDANGDNIGNTIVAFDLKASGLSTVTIAGTSYQVTSPFPTGIKYPLYPQNPKALGTLAIVFTDGTLSVPYSSDTQCSSGRGPHCVPVITVMPTAALDGETANQ